VRDCSLYAACFDYLSTGISGETNSTPGLPAGSRPAKPWPCPTSGSRERNKLASWRNGNQTDNAQQHWEGKGGKGLVGNQSGIRSAALFRFNLSKEAFVATATATALIVDGARMPVYLLVGGSEVIDNWHYVTAATAGVLAGTMVGERVLRRIPEQVFQRVVAAIIPVLGISMFFYLF
jgi:hypothetical protein